MNPVADVISGVIRGIIESIQDLPTKEQVKADLLASLRSSPPDDVAQDYANARNKVLPPNE